MIKTLQFCLITFFCLTTSLYSQKKWELLNPRPTYNTGKSVQFISDNTGYIITNTEIIETLDSGISWKTKQIIESGNDLKFNNTLGFIIGNSGYVLKSVDSGKSWTRLYTGFNDNFNTVNIIDEKTIIISSSNSIIKSLDGGSSWKSFSIPNQTVNKTFFTTELIGHAACNNGTMLKTIDGGVSWYNTMSTNTFPSNFFTIYFINQNIGFATREHGELYKTIDGGETWVKNPAISDALFAFCFLNVNVGYATGDSGVIFKTIDGGDTWTWAGFQNGRFYASNMYGIKFIDADRGFVTGFRGRIIKTIDGGKTWVENSPTYNDVSKLDFVSKDIGYAKVGNSFYKTNDSGANWKLISSIDYDRYYSITGFDFLNENIGYAATGGTYGGYVFKTIDGGVTWNVLNNNYELIDEGVSTLSFINEQTGYISGGFNQRKLLKTTDGGSTWHQTSNLNFAQTEFLNENVGYAHNNYDKKVYKTVDGGSNWQVMFEAKEEIKSISFLDIDNGYIVGSNGLLFKTVNGGLDWIKLQLPYEYYTFIKFYSKNVGYVFDEEGQLFKTTNGGRSWERILLQNNPYSNNSITFVDKDIYLAGSYGKIQKSQVDFDPFAFQLNAAENIKSRSATISGNAASNEGTIENVRIEYFDNITTNKVEISSKTISSDSSLDFIKDITDLAPSRLYFYRIIITRNNVDYYSETSSFTTQPDFAITIDPSTNILAKSAVVNASVVSNYDAISDIEFQYSRTNNFSSYEVLKSDKIIQSNSTERISEVLPNLQTKTTYYVRLKGVHQGKEIYSLVSSFVTKVEYEIYTFNPSFNGNDVTLTANIKSNDKDISNIVFEYGTLNYENNISADISLIGSGLSSYVSAKLSNLDPNKVYFFRVKAQNGSDVIYGKEGIINISKKMIMIPANISYDITNSIQLNGFINSNGKYFSNIEFEYGTTENFGTSIITNPFYVYNYSETPVSATLSNLESGKKYYYRLKANDGSDLLYSEMSSFTTATLGIENPNFNKSIAIYPNPTDGVVNIDVSENKVFTSFKVIDQMGKVVIYKKNIESENKNNQKIDLSGKASGIYLIQIILDDSSIINRKLIIN